MTSYVIAVNAAGICRPHRKKNRMRRCTCDCRSTDGATREGTDGGCLLGKKPGFAETEGTVTILMTFVTVLILSLILVSLESARQQGAVAVLRMNVQTAAESVLGEYYAPLFDDYGIYGLYDVDIAEEIQSYLETSGRPDREVSGSNPGEDKSCYSFAYDISEVALSRTVSLLHGGTAICRNQMIEEGAVSGIQELAEMLLRSVKLLKDSEGSLNAIEAQQKVQRELAAFDSKLLSLSQLIDGLKTDSSGVVFRENGLPETVPWFVKRALTVPVSQESVSMNNRSFYERLKPSYVNIAEISKEYSQKLDSIVASGGKIDEEIIQLFSTLSLAVHDSYFATIDAIPILDDLIEMQDKLRPMITEFESFMKSCQTLIDDDIYKSLEETLRILKGYAGAKDGAKTYDFSGMRKRLKKNKEILEPVYELTKKIPNVLQNWQSVQKVKDMLSGYSVQGLKLDYSTVRKSTETNTSFWQKIKSIVTEGIVGGVYPSGETLSKTSIRWEPDLPSTIVEEDLQSLYVFPDLVEEGSLSVNLLQHLMDGNLLRSLLDRLAEGVVDLSEKLLLVAYFSTHMSNYTDTVHSGVMHYEQEYLLFGKYGDDQNQRSATLSILGIRVLMNILHVITDSTKQAEAMAVAAALLSAVPFEALIKIVQYLILVVWGIQNAYLETAEILQGKAVPLLVTAGSFQLSLTNAAAMSRDKRTQMAREYQPPAGFNLGYDHYLMIFMLLRDGDTMVGRALDLIQVNIRAKYDSKFLLRNCIYGFEADVTAEMDALYTVFSVSGTGVDRNMSYTIRESCALSY